MTRSDERWDEHGTDREPEAGARLKLLMDEADEGAKDSKTEAGIAPYVWAGALAGAGVITFLSLRSRKRRSAWPPFRISIEPARTTSRGFVATACGALARFALEQFLAAQARGLQERALDYEVAAATTTSQAAQDLQPERRRTMENGHPKV